MIPAALLTNREVFHFCGITKPVDLTAELANDSSVLQDYLQDHDLAIQGWHDQDVVLQGNARKWAVYYVLQVLEEVLGYLLSTRDTAKIQEINNWIHGNPVDTTVFDVRTDLWSPKMLWDACSIGSVDSFSQTCYQISGIPVLNIARLCYALDRLEKHLPPCPSHDPQDPR